MRKKPPLEPFVAESPVVIELDSDRALVLFEWLSDRSDDGRLRQIAPDASDYWSLQAILGPLESQLVEPFRPDYSELVASARARIIEQTGGFWDE